MLSLGIDTHENAHQAEVQNNNEIVLWSGRIMNNRSGLESLVEKIHVLEESNGDKVIGIFVNPTANYHLPVKHFLEKNGFTVYCVDTRVAKNMRGVENLGKEKSDPEDAHILASTPWKSKKYLERKGHERDPLSEITRLRKIVSNNITRIKNFIWADISAIFPEFGTMFSLDSVTALMIQEKYTTPENFSAASVKDLQADMNIESRNHTKDGSAEKVHALALESIGIPDIEDAYATRIRINVKRLRQEIDTLSELDKEIIKRSENNQTVAYLSDIRGMGKVNSASIVSEIGRIEQFDSALKLQSYGGKCPDMEGSGGKAFPRGVTKIRNAYLSNAVHESAVSLVKHMSGEFYELFLREKEKGKNNNAAYIAVGKRLLYHTYSIMKNKKPYRERRPTERGRIASTGI